jgi:hypothetical protein
MNQTITFYVFCQLQVFAAKPSRASDARALKLAGVAPTAIELGEK